MRILCDPDLQLGAIYRLIRMHFYACELLICYLTKLIIVFVQCDNIGPDDDF